MTADIEVLAVLANTKLALEAQACLAAISAGEVPTVAGQSPFRILYSGGSLLDPTNANVITVGRWRYWTGNLSAFPAWAGAKLANGLISTAAGFCQDTHTTFKDNGFGITTFDPQSQIVFNWKLAQVAYGERSGGGSLLSVLRGTSSGLALIPAYLGKTWPGGCDSGFPRRFAANLVALKNPIMTPPPQPTSLPCVEGHYA